MVSRTLLWPRLLAVAVVLAPIAVVASSDSSAVAAGRPLMGIIVGAASDVRLPREPATCEESSGGGYRHAGSAALPSSVLGLAGGRADIALGIGRSATGAFLEPGSRLTLTTQRGLLQLDLAGGSCANAGLSVAGDVVSGTVTWTIDQATSTGGYAGSTGSGIAHLTARLASDGDLPWTLDLDGGADARQPQLSARLVRSYWGRLGTQYATRMSSAVFVVTNTGSGTAYGAAVDSVTAPNGITAVQTFPADLDELSPRESVEVTVRYRIGITGRRSGPLLVGRSFETTLNLVSHDALEQPVTDPVSLRVSTPAFPPSL